MLGAGNEIRDILWLHGATLVMDTLTKKTTKKSSHPLCGEKTQTTWALQLPGSAEPSLWLIPGQTSDMWGRKHPDDTTQRIELPPAIWRFQTHALDNMEQSQAIFTSQWPLGHSLSIWNTFPTFFAKLDISYPWRLSIGLLFPRNHLLNPLDGLSGPSPGCFSISLL